MKKNIKLIMLLALMTSCEPTVVDRDKDQKIDQSREVKSIDGTYKVVEEEKLPDGLTIKWFERGSGESISYGDVIAIDYKVYLRNQEVIDGNHLLNKPFIPFLVGFNMQTPGWEMALKKMKVGDFAEVYIPSKLARGDKAVEGLFPANSDNILKIRVLRKIKPNRTVDGTKVWLIEENESNKLAFNEKNSISFHCMAFTPSKPLFINTYRDDKPFTAKLEDHGLVPGLKKALINAKRSDRMLILVPAEEAYKSEGYLDLVKPDEDILYNVLVMNVLEK